MKKRIAALLSMSFMASLAFADPESMLIPKDLKTPESSRSITAETKDEKLKNNLGLPSLNNFLIC